MLEFRAEFPELDYEGTTPRLGDDISSFQISKWAKSQIKLTRVLDSKCHENHNEYSHKHTCLHAPKYVTYAYSDPANVYKDE